MRGAPGFYPGPSRKINCALCFFSLWLFSCAPFPRTVESKWTSKGSDLFRPGLRTVVSVCMLVVDGFGNLGPMTLHQH